MTRLPDTRYSTRAVTTLSAGRYTSGEERSYGSRNCAERVKYVEIW